MSGTHLKQDEVLRWQLGEASEAERLHVATCVACQAQVQPLVQALQGFGAATRQWGEAKATMSRPKAAPAEFHLQWRMLAAVCALLLIAIGMGAVRWQAHEAALHAAAIRRQAEQQLAQDNALLEAIDQDVSQVTPQALTPLSASASVNTGSLQQ